MDKKHYPTAFLVVIAFALYVMYGDMFSLKNIDFAAYKDICEKYQSDKTGTYSDAEVLGLVNKINYILPDSIEQINEPLQKEIKKCAIELSQRLSEKNNN